MPRLKVNDIDVTVEPGTLLIEACRKVGISIPHYCSHQALAPVATCRMCVVEVKGQAKLVTSCSTPATEGMEVHTNTLAVADARASVMEFLLMNHPLDCPICDQAGECKLQDYSYQFGSGDSRMIEAKRRYRYEDLGAKIVLDKNRCIHCTRCVRFTQEVSETHELTMAYRGADLEVTTYAGESLDENPLAGNIVDLCPVGALTSRDFRFTKRVWFLKPVPTISRMSALASPLWADVDENKVWRFRPRPMEGNFASNFIMEEERRAFHRYNLDPSTRLRTPQLRGEECTLEPITRALREHAPVAVIVQGTFGCDAAQRLGLLASSAALRFGAGERTYPVQFPKLQTVSDGVLNRRGFVERGYQFGHLESVLAMIHNGTIKAVVLLHDDEFSSTRERKWLQNILGAVPFSLVLEPIPSELSSLATALLPVTTYLEESDFVVNHEGKLRRYMKALEAPKGVKPAYVWAREIQSLRLSPVSIL